MRYTCATPHEHLDRLAVHRPASSACHVSAGNHHPFRLEELREAAVDLQEQEDDEE